MNDNKFIAVAGVYISPSNKNQSLEEVDNFITSSFLLANANYKAIVGDFNVNLDLNAKLGRKDRNKMKQIMTKNNVIDSIDFLRQKREKYYTFVGKGRENISTLPVSISTF